MLNYTTPDTSSLHTATLPGRVLPHDVVHQVVVQKGEVIIKRYWPTAGLWGRVLMRKPPVVSEVIKDFVIVCLRLPAGSGAVPEYHFLAGAVTQPKVCHIEVDLFEHTALSSSVTSLYLPSCLPSSSSSSSSSTLLACPLLPFPPESSPAAQVFFGGGRGRGGGR